MSSKRLMLIILILALLIMACAPSWKWAHPTKDRSQLERDAYECEQVAFQAVANMGFKNNPFLIAEEKIKCLELRHGWQRVAVK